MSRYDWEFGTIKLPSADFARLRKAMQDSDAKVKQRALNRTQEFWKGLTRKQRTDSKAYTTALREWSRAQEQAPVDRWRGYQQPDPVEEAARDQAYSLLHAKSYGGAPSRVLASEVQMPTNRTTDFQLPDGVIRFDKATSSVTWEVSENNHAVERCRGHVLGQRFFDELGKVRWTRGTGGTISGNDEYSREADYAGGGANYCTAGFGPIGAVEAPTHTEPWTDPQGRRFAVETKLGRYGFVGKAVEVDRSGRPVKRTRPAGGSQAPRAAAPATPGVRGRHAAGSSRGGQFASTSAPEADVELEHL